MPVSKKLLLSSLTLTLILFFTSIQTSNGIEILGNLESILNTGKKANIFITLSNGPEKLLNSLMSKTFGSRADKLNSLTNSLKKHANETQQVVIDLIQKFAALTGQNVTVQQYWISNQVYVKGANNILVTMLKGLGSIIGLIKEEIFAGFWPINPVDVNKTESDQPWGLEKIQASDALRVNGVLRSEKPIVVASIDSGVRYTHGELKDNYVGDYGWYDPVEETPLPNDQSGHGTHTMGTMVGQRTGVFPNAKWMSCKGCQTDACAQSDLLACGQFLLCPTKPDRSAPDCSKAPTVINNSWGSDKGGDSSYKAMIDAWRAAGIIPVFAIGNSGPSCSTANSPGDYPNVISVGATNIKNELASFSSRGPVNAILGFGGQQKPDLSAPGQDIVSAWHTGDYDYKSISGTSMAAPHVSATVAMMFSAKPGLKYDDVKNELIKGTTNRELKRPFRTCESPIFGYRYPNNEFGSGCLNALNTLTAVAA